jgi:pimeloyl-ACP methyl ester carboxylesterase
VRRFHGEREAITIDLPGFGDAAGEPERDVAGMAAAVRRRIDDARIGPCILVGHSMSGKVATVVADASDDLRGLVLVTSSPPSPEPMTAAARHKLMGFDGSLSAAEDYIDGITATRLPDRLRDVAIADARRASPDAWHAWVAAGSREDWSNAVGRLSLPTLVVAGASDPSLGTTVQREHVLPHFTDARLVVIAGGHALPYENPADLHREIAAFAATCDADASAAPLTALKGQA